MKQWIDKHQKLIGIIVVTAILFTRCNLGLTMHKGFVVANLLADLLGAGFLAYLFIKDKKPLKEAFLSPAVAWIVVFSAIVLVYGHFHIRYGAQYFSRQITVLTVVPAIILLGIFYYLKEELLDVISVSGAAVIVTTLIVSLKFDSVWAEWLVGRYARVGATPAGGVIETGNLILILLIPILYQLIVYRKVKQYLFITLLGLFEIIGTGAKSSVLPLVFVFAIMVIGASDDKRIIRRNLIIVAIAAVVGGVAIMVVPPLYGVIGYRIAEMFTGMAATEFDLQTSTGQRMAMIAAFKEHFMEYPVFGHGFYAFKEMPYSAIEAVRLDDMATQFIYQHIQLHMNYLEILFSFGIFGFVAYYWFPLYTLLKSIKADKKARIFVFSIMISLLFMDLGLDMYYRYLLPYYSYFLAYFMVANGKRDEK